MPRRVNKFCVKKALRMQASPHVIERPPPPPPKRDASLNIVPVPRQVINGYGVPDDWVIEHWMNLPKEVPKKKYQFKDRLGAHGLDHLKKPPPKPKPKKRGRPPKKNRSSRKHREDPYRLSPSTRPGRRFHTVSVPELAYAQMKEMALFYEMPIAQVITKLAAEAFERAMEESLLLARITANRDRESPREKTPPTAPETPDEPQPPRRTHF
jgi:hypothetical protein